MRLGACAWLMATVVILLFVIGALSVASAADDSEFRPLDEFEAEDEWTFHTYLGVVLFILYLALIIIPRLSGRIPVVTTAVSRFGAKLEELATPKRKWWTMLTLGAMALYAYGYCHHICEKGGVPIFDCNIIFFHLLFRFSLALFPYFIGGCIVGGLIMKYFSTGRLTIPDSMLGSSMIAALIPVCACGAIPLVKALLSTGQLRVRTVISFLIVVPVLSPFVIFFSFQLGAVYVATRIIAIFVLAMVGGVVIERFVGVEAAEPSSCFLACKGCMRSTIRQSGRFEQHAHARLGHDALPAALHRRRYPHWRGDREIRTRSARQHVSLL